MGFLYVLFIEMIDIFFKYYKLNVIIMIGLFVTFIYTFKINLKINRSTILFIFCFLLIIFNAINNSISSALKDIFTLLFLFAFFIKIHKTGLNDNKITLVLNVIYLAVLIELSKYFWLVSINDSYSFIKSNDPFHRESIGWWTISAIYLVQFDHRLKYSKFGFPLIVMVILYFNTSRTELLIGMFYILISIYHSLWRFKKILFTSFFIILISMPAIDVIDLGKFRLDEVGKELVSTEKMSKSEAYSNYRAFENLAMVNKIFDNFTGGLIIGCGPGCSVDLNYLMVLDGNEYSKISVFHNGYLSFILMYGLFGIFLIIMLFNRWKYVFEEFLISANIYKKSFSNVHILLPAYTNLLFSTFTSGGFASPRDLLICSLIIVLSRKV